MKCRRIRMWLPSILALLLVVAACASDDAPDAAGAPEAPDAPDAPDTPDAGADEDAVAEFYEGKTITIQVGASSGGGYDQMGRLLADHWGRFIPGNPSFRVENMEGARGVVSMNYMQNAAPRDGTELVMANRAVFLDQLLERDGVEFDLREFFWLGNPIQDASMCVAHERTGLETFDDVLEQPLTLGVNVPLEQPFLMEITGAQFEIVSGYAGGSEVNLAIEQGEVDGRCPWSISSVLSHSDQDFVNSINLLLEMSVSPHPLVPDGVPHVLDYASDEMEEQLIELFFADTMLGRPVHAPPETPQERVDALVAAFAEMVEDEEFLADAEERGLEIVPVLGGDLQELADRLLNPDPEVLERLRQLLADIDD